MALVNLVQKKVILSKWETVKLQILFHCYVNKISVSDSDLECLTLLSFNSPIELTSFCYDASEEESIFKSSQSVRNAINKAEKLKLVVKNPENKKQILINPDLKIQTDGTVMLDYKILGKPNDAQETN